jgi:hypothetical protein
MGQLKISCSLFFREVLAVTVAYRSLLGGFAGELAAFKAEFNAFGECAVADLAELVFSCNATDASVWARAAGHFGAFLAGDSADSYFQNISPTPVYVAGWL